MYIYTHTYISVYIQNLHMSVCIHQYTHIYIFRFSSKHLKSLRKEGILIFMLMFYQHYNKTEFFYL